jgi:HD-like signal output (HDOD) protein
MSTFTTSGNTSSAGGKTLPPAVQKAVARVTELGSLPEVTARIVQLVEDPDTTAADMKNVVQSDPALAAKVLKIVNSAFYGLPSQISSLDRAILMLGLTAVKNLSLATSMYKLLKAGPICDQFKARDLWLHCIAVGVCSRELAKAARMPQPDEAFVAGLVHDMGLIVAQQLFPDQLRSVAEQCFAQPTSFIALEESTIGADHQVLGGVLATKWKFPPGLRFAIGYHHAPRFLQPEFQKIASIVYVADTLCCAAQYGFYLTANTQELSDEVLELAGLARSGLEPVMEALPDQVAEAEEVFSGN